MSIDPPTPRSRGRCALAGQLFERKSADLGYGRCMATTPFGTGLWELRTGHRLTLREAAAVTGIPRATLSDWEHGGTPSSAEEALRVLIALGCEAGDAGSLLERSGIALRPPSIGDVRPLPDLLMGLRCASGLSVGGAARLLGVAKSTVSRWESGDATPSAEMRDRVVSRLNANPHWASALASASVMPLKGIERSCPRPASEILPEYALWDDRTIDLLLLAARERVQPLALESEAWRRTMVEIHERACVSLMGRGQFGRLRRWTAAGLWWAEGTPGVESARAGLEMMREYVLARDIREEGRDVRVSVPDVDRRIRALRRVDSTAEGHLRAWASRNVARYLVWAGRADLAAPFHRRATAEALASGAHHSVVATEFTLATNALASGDPEGCLRGLSEGEAGRIAHTDLFNHLRRCEAFLALGQTREAEAAYEVAMGIHMAAEFPHRAERQGAYRRTSFEPVRARLEGRTPLRALPHLEI